MPDIKNIEAAIALSKEDESKVLGLTIGAQKVKVTPGQHIPKGEAQLAPELSFNGAATGTTYIVIGIDLDAPFPSFSVLSPILHWLQPGLKPTDGTTNLIAPDDAPFIADYAGPGPPPPSSPHRYVFLLYEQPVGFDPARFAPPGGKKMGIRPRMRETNT
ncbi:hypothetical protein G7Y89_g5540 [Cudoniella acicularis]|uniref:PEBP-like protein n=1 Tax=Cudoniella acicularis TaxID=354080 RepID=A0A8H4RPK4_9HELO|nr:hypothetical protein G7Y89_g5540 [Cudoniella acicularis]